MWLVRTWMDCIVAVAYPKMVSSFGNHNYIAGGFGFGEFTDSIHNHPSYTIIAFWLNVSICLFSSCDVGLIMWISTALWELHGNNNMEKCKKCGHEYLRDFKCSRSKMKHLTGRNCDDPKCGGKLRDTIINFGESLPDGKRLWHV